MGIKGLTFWSFRNLGWEALPYFPEQLVRAVKGLSCHKQIPDCIKDPSKSPGPGPHVTPLHHPQNEFRRELGNQQRRSHHTHPHRLVPGQADILPR